MESALKASGVDVQPLWQSASNHALVSAAAEGLGLTVLPLSLVRSALDSDIVRQFWVEGIRFPRRCQLLYHQNKYLTRPMQALIRLCRQTWCENQSDHQRK